jgi:hypothetical protein
MSASNGGHIMKSTEFGVLRFTAVKVMTWAYLCWGIGDLIAYSQEPPTPAPPLPHSRPSLPGTHVLPQPTSQKSQIALHIDAPATAIQGRCGQQTFAIKYSVTNHSTASANGDIRATFNGVLLTPMASTKLTDLAPGKVASGAFSACCPSAGLFAARMEYRGPLSEAHRKTTGDANLISDSVNISCK